MYLGHNYQFLAFSAAMEGRKAETLEATRQSRATIPDEMLLAMPGFDWIIGDVYSAKVRFGMWDEMLAEAPPNPKLPGLSGAYLYGKPSLLPRRKVDDARATVAQLDKLATDTPADYGAGFNSARDMFAIGSLIAGRTSRAPKTRPTTNWLCFEMRSPKRIRPPTTSRQTGSSRCVICSARSCSRWAKRRTRRAYIAKISSGIRIMAGRCLA